MPLYQRKTLSTNESVGGPGALPAQFRGLSDAVLADLSPYGLADTGFFPVPPPEPEPETPSRWIHKAIFKRRFTPEERIAIRAATPDNPVLADFMDIVDSTNEINLDDPDLVQGLAYLVSLGLLAPDRPTQIRE